MRAFDPNCPLIFIHVPKTAGTSVREIMKSWFPNRVYRHYYDEAAGGMPQLLPLKTAEFMKNPPVIYGHFNRLRGFGIEDYYPDVSQFVTILRDPFEVAISNYFFVRKVSKNWKDKSRVPTESLEDYIKSTELNIVNHFPRVLTLENYKDVIEELFVEVGITEDLPKSLKMIALKLGKEFDPTKLGVINATERDQPLPDSYRDQFYEKHKLEYALYEYVKSHVLKADIPV